MTDVLTIEKLRRVLYALADSEDDAEAEASRDRIVRSQEALHAEIRRLEDHLRGCREQRDAAEAMCAKAEAEVERVRKGLRVLAGFGCTEFVGYAPHYRDQKAQKIGRNLLAGREWNNAGEEKP